MIPDFRSHPLELVRLRLPRPPEIQLAPAAYRHQVDVGVGYEEPFHDHPYPLRPARFPYGRGERPRRAEKLRVEGRLGIEDVIHVLLRYHQGVAGVDWVDVQESEHIIVLE